jgi:hypothetical protein
MSKSVDDFSKNLASGMSRRGAFWRLLAGVGALGFLGVAPQKAIADKRVSDCVNYCVTLADEAYMDCIFDGGTEDYCFYDVRGAAYVCCAQNCSEGKSVNGCRINGTTGFGVAG